jgi:hypothetical protein
MRASVGRGTVREYGVHKKILKGRRQQGNKNVYLNAKMKDNRRRQGARISLKNL